MRSSSMTMAQAISPEELLETIGQRGGACRRPRRPVPFKWPQGTLARGIGDSDYCQLGAWEHVR